MNQATNSKESTTDGVSIISISSEKTRKYMDKIHAYAEDVIHFYKTVVGFYPHNSLQIIPGSNDYEGGYPVNTGVIAIHGVDNFDTKPESWWKWITAHEIAHMYFGYCIKEKNREQGSQLGWVTKGLGLYLDSLFMKEKVNCTKYHQEYIKIYLDAKKKGLNTSFSLTPSEIEALGSDYNYNEVVMHGRAYYVISEIEKIVGSKQFKKLIIKLIRNFKNRELGFEDFVSFIQNHDSPDFMYEVD